MKLGILLTWILCISMSVTYRTPKERNLLYKERDLPLPNKTLKNGRILKEVPNRKLAMFGPGDDEVVKIKAKKDMLQKKIDMDNGTIKFLLKI